MIEFHLSEVNLFAMVFNLHLGSIRDKIYIVNHILFAKLYASYANRSLFLLRDFSKRKLKENSVLRLYNYILAALNNSILYNFTVIRKL